MLKGKNRLLFLRDKGKYFIYPSLLVLLWMILTVFYIVTFDTSFSIWSYSHSNKDIKNLTHNLLYKGDTIRGEFAAQDNNLGIVAVRFQTYTRPPYSLEDRLLFELKEKDSSKIYYSNVYRSGSIYDVPFFPFGFPQIANSKGKTYDFIITSLNGNHINALSLSERYPILQSKYKYSGSYIIRQPLQLIKFICIKFYNALKTPDVMFSSFIYLLPLIFYLLWKSALEKILHNLLKNTNIGEYGKLLNSGIVSHLEYFLLSIVFLDIFVFQLTNDVIYIVIAGLWILSLKVDKRIMGISFLVALLLLCMNPIFLYIKMQPLAEKITIWSYIFLVAGFVQALMELKETEKVKQKR